MKGETEMGKKKNLFPRDERRRTPESLFQVREEEERLPSKCKGKGCESRKDN